MEDIDIAKKVIALLGGDDGLAELNAKHIETVPLGVRFVVHRDNPGNVTVTITLSKARFDVEISGHTLWGMHRFDELQDWELTELFQTVKWYAK